MFKSQLIGRLTADARSLQDGKGNEFIVFDVAENQRRAGVEQTTYFKVSAGNASNVFPYLKKGRQVYVEGRATVDQYTDRGGIVHTSIRILTNGGGIQLLGGSPAQEGDAV